jgi:TPR repeat protein
MGFPGASEDEVRLYVRKISGTLTVVDHFNTLARTGSARAMFYLGCTYEHGDLGIGADQEQALHWFWEAADAGDPLAQTWFAMLVTEPDVAERYYAMGAAQGEPDSMNNLRCLIEGRDLARARQLYTSAAEAGHPAATLNLGRLQEAEGNTKKRLRPTPMPYRGAARKPVYLWRGSVRTRRCCKNKASTSVSG